jgi:hypothetical protein
MKAISIENKWFATMVQLMYQKYKYDNKFRFQLKVEDISSEEYCLQQIMYPNNYPSLNDINLETFFYIKNNRYVSEDKGFNEGLFLEEIRFFSLQEQNDTITLSSNLLENEENFRFYMDSFSNSKAFQNFCM